jgi:PPOX class probable FMN-dependent enzyme
MAPHKLTSRVIASEDALRDLIGLPTDLVCAKLSTTLNPLTRQFIERSPFLCIATHGADGTCDVSPRGDPPGFVRILDEQTLLIPERPGNRIADSLRNILCTGRIGVLFVIPGVGDSLRVNGKAALTDDAELLAPCVVEDKLPKLGILVDIEEAYTQCSKAFLRSHLWDPSRFVDRASLPTNGAILAELARRDARDFDAARYDEERAARYARRDGFY